MPHKSPVLIVGLLIFVMLLWGGSFIAIKIGLRYLTPFELVAVRFIPSALMLLSIGLWSGRKSGSGGLGFWRSLSKREWALTLAASFFAVPAYHFCLNYGETLIPAGWASLVISLNPAFIVLFASLMLHEHIGLRRWGGIGLAFAGLMIITLGQDAPSVAGFTATTMQKVAGVLITLGAVIAWGAFTTIAKRLMTGRNALENLGWIMTLGAIWSIPGLSPETLTKFESSGKELLWAVGFLSVCCTVISFIIWFWALKQWPASRVGAFIYLVPLFALAIGLQVLGEQITAVTLLGSAGVLGGVLLAATSTHTVRGSDS